MPPFDSAVARTMEAAVASSLLAAAADCPLPASGDHELVPLTAWSAVSHPPRSSLRRRARLPGGGYAVPVEVVLSDDEALSPALIADQHAQGQRAGD